LEKGAKKKLTGAGLLLDLLIRRVAPFTAEKVVCFGTGLGMIWELPAVHPCMLCPAKETGGEAGIQPHW